MTSFVDTNVFVYAFDRSEPDKRAIALRLLDDPEASYATSAQVLSEFYVTVTRKLHPALSSEEARGALRHIGKLPVIAIDDRLVIAATELAEREQIGLWDAQIVQAAARAGCAEILTEDLNAGQTYAGVPVRNPFA
ncbi:MAG: PIN domain-containing protein [Acidimicrobiia bacterium]|nr:PIN domain-containing protein [Acidimicrobiia bacterium]